MRSFLLNTSILVFSFLLLSFCIVVGLNSLVSSSGRFQLEPNVKSIVIGHSHAECAINDNMISGVKNMAESGEAYFYSYLKTKKLLEENPQIENVYLELANNQLSIKSEEGLWKNKYLNYRFPKYSFLMEGNDLLSFYMKGESSIFSVLALSIQDQFSYLISSKSALEFFEWGGFIALEEKLHVAKEWSQIEKGVYLLNSERTIKDLNRIIDLCKDRGVKLHLFRSPVHKEYPGRINESYYTSIIEGLESEGVMYKDYANMELPDSCFADYGHLNVHGAGYFTKVFIEDHNLEKKD